ncbi:unnamed protein product, partial [Musa acuminata var. zebrina]
KLKPVSLSYKFNFLALSQLTPHIRFCTTVKEHGTNTKPPPTMTYKNQNTM